MHARHVVSQELARKLQAAGFPQESEFQWIEQEGHYRVGQMDLRAVARGEDVVCAAPLASEVAEQLPMTTALPSPDGIEGPAYFGLEANTEGAEKYVACYFHVDMGSEHHDAIATKSDSLADALAALWLALKAAKR